MRVAATAVDFPEDPEPTYEAALGRIRTPQFSDSACSHWAARVAGKLVATSQSALLAGVNARLAHIDVLVHPRFRNQGLAVRLLRPALGNAVDAGREVIISTPVKADSPGLPWLTALGFEVANHTVIQALVVEEAVRELWDSPVAPGYRLDSWSGSAPPALLESYAAAMRAIADAPLGRSSYQEDAVKTPERIRETERSLAASGADERVVVAIAEATHEVVGLTRVLRYPHRLDLGYQMTTAVMADHRGHGLGLSMKGRMMGVLTQAWPELERIHTSTSAANKHMIGVNVALGYRTHREMMWTETRTQDLANLLGSLRTGRGSAVQRKHRTS